MSKAPETIYIDRDGAIGRWYTQLEKDVDVAYVRGDIAYAYASEVEKLRARIESLEFALGRIEKHAAVLTTHGIETMARDALEKA